MRIEALATGDATAGSNEGMEAGIGTAIGRVRTPPVGEPPDPLAPPAGRGAPSGIKRRVPTGGARHATGDPVLHYRFTLPELEAFCAWVVTGRRPPQPFDDRDYERSGRLLRELSIHCADPIVAVDVAYELFIPEALVREIMFFAYAGAEGRDLARRERQGYIVPHASKVTRCVERFRSQSGITQR